jgi:hypothetical protein
MLAVSFLGYANESGAEPHHQLCPCRVSLLFDIGMALSMTFDEYLLRRLRCRGISQGSRVVVSAHKSINLLSCTHSRTSASALLVTSIGQAVAALLSQVLQRRRCLFLIALLSCPDLLAGCLLFLCLFSLPELAASFLNGLVSGTGIYFAAAPQSEAMVKGTTQCGDRRHGISGGCEVRREKSALKTGLGCCKCEARGGGFGLDAQSLLNNGRGGRDGILITGY